MTNAPVASGVFQAITDLGPTIRGYADQCERERTVPQALIETLLDARIFDMVLPRMYGGLEVDVMTMMRVIEEASVADGATGWAIGIGVGTSIVSGALAEQVAREIFQPRVIIGGAQAPMGRATVVEGGYRVTGQWPFASGCRHCAWLVGSSVVVDSDPRPGAAKPQLALRPKGMPEVRLMVFPKSDVEILDTWSVSGLRGTGSNDIAVTDVFVPRERTIGLLVDRPRLDGPLYRYPMLSFLALTVAPVAAGVARRAIDELVALAAAKTPFGSPSKLGERAVTQFEIAQAEATLRSARAFMYETAEEIWDAVVAGSDVTIEQRSRLRMACAHMAMMGAKAVDTAYTLGGGTAVYDKSVLQRCLRDAHAATQHIMLAPPNYETHGRIMLGLAPLSPMV